MKLTEQTEDYQLVARGVTIELASAIAGAAALIGWPEAFRAVASAATSVEEGYVAGVAEAAAQHIERTMRKRLTRVLSRLPWRRPRITRRGKMLLLGAVGGVKPRPGEKEIRVEVEEEASDDS